MNSNNQIKLMITPQLLYYAPIPMKLVLLDNCIKMFGNVNKLGIQIVEISLHY